MPKAEVPNGFNSNFQMPKSSFNGNFPKEQAIQTPTLQKSEPQKEGSMKIFTSCLNGVMTKELVNLNPMIFKT